MTTGGSASALRIDGLGARLRSYKGIGYPTVLDGISSAADLHPLRQRRLALLLVESRIFFDHIDHDDRTVSPKASAGTIKNLLGSLDLLSSFARKANAGQSAKLPGGHKCDPASLDAMKRMLQTADEMDRDHQSGDRAARAAVLGFFSTVEQIYRIANETERATRATIQAKDSGRAIVWLCGERLPEVYSKIFRAPFTTTRGRNPGVEFVQQSLRSMKVRENTLSEETIISHYKAAKG